MSDNTGKKLRDKNLDQFESLPRPAGHSVGGGSFDHSQSQQQYDKYEAGKSFSQEGIFESPFKNDYFDSKYLGINAGSVTNDIEEDHRGVYDVKNSHIDFEQLKSKGQSSYGKGAAMLTKLGAKTGVNIVGNIIGSLYGIGEYAYDHVKGNETDITTVWDNTVTRELDEWTKAIDRGNSVFVDPTSGVGFNAKTFNEVADAYSFIAGMVMSEVIMQSAGNLAGGTGLTTFAPRMAKNLNTISKILKGADKLEDAAKIAEKSRKAASKIQEAAEKTQKGALHLTEQVNKMSAFKRAKDITKAVGTGVGNFGRRTLTTGGYEAGLEARQAKDEVMQNGMAEIEYYLSRRPDMSAEEKALFRKEHMKELEKNAKIASMASFGFNSAVLGASRLIQFPQIFGNSFVKFKGINKILRPELGKAGYAKGFKGVAKAAPGALFRIAKNPTTEFFEETFQGVISNGVKNQFELTLGDRTQGGILTPHTNKFADNLWRAVEETYGSSEGRHEGIIGAIVGGIGLPGMRKYKKSAAERKESDSNKKHGYKFQWQGGVYEDFMKEKARWKATSDAVNIVNGSGISDALAYNKDNAIRTALDVEEEQVALDTDNEIAFESVRDNRVYRYTMDRMDKGLGDHIKQDIEELEQMDLETYKKTFKKDETFSEKEMKDEVENFKKKVKVYQNAYKVVHKRFNENLLRKDRTSKKMIDMLTYAVATEKVQMQRRDAMIEELHAEFNGELTKDELQEFFRTSAKTAAVENELNEYVELRETDKKAKHLKKSGFDKAKSQLDKAYNERVEAVKNSDKTEEEKQQELSDLKANHESRLNELEQKHLAGYKSFHANKSSKVKALKNKLDDINQKIEASVSDSMKAISGPAERLTEKELHDHLMLRQKMIEAANKKEDSGALLDRVDRISSQEDVQTKLRKINEIADRMVTAHKVAKVLYGVDKPDGYLAMALSKVAMAELFEDLSNLDKIQEQIRFSDENSELRSDEAKALIEEYSDLIDIVKENRKEAAISLSRLKGDDGKAFREHLSDAIKEHEEFLADIKEKLGIAQAKTEQNKANAKQANADQNNENISNADEEERNKKANQEKKENKDDDDTPVNEPELDDPNDIRNAAGGIKPQNSKGGTRAEDLDDKESDTIDDFNKLRQGVHGKKDGKKAKPKPDPTQGAGASKASKQREITSREQYNTLTIAESDPSKKTKSNYSIYSEQFDKMLNYQGDNNQGFLDKAPAMLQSQEIDPDKIPWLENYLLNLPKDKRGDRTGKDIFESYKRGAAKIKDAEANEDGQNYQLVEKALKTTTAKELADVDLDIYTVIAFAPMSFSVYDQQIKPKKVDKQEDGSYKLDYRYDESILDKPAYTQNFFFSPDAMILDPDELARQKLERYHKKKAKLDNDFAEIKKKYKAGSERLSREQVRYEAELEDLRNSNINWGHNSFTQFDFRKRLFRNRLFKKNNNYKLIVDHVNLGEFQHHNYDPPVGGVAENTPETLGFNASEMTIDDVYVYTNYSKNKANYKRIDGVPLNRLPNNPFPFLEKKNYAASGAIYFKYTDQSGKHIPIKMNTGRLGMEHADAIIDLMEQFFAYKKEHGNKGEFIVKNNDIKFLNGKTMKEAMLFFLRQQKGSSGKASTIANAFSIYEDKKGDEPSQIRLYLGNGQPLEFSSLEDLNTLKEDDDANLRGLLSDSRFWIDKLYLTNTTKKKSTLNNEVMQYYFDNGIISHHFQGGTIYKPGSKKSITLSRAESKAVGKRTRKKEPPKENNVLIDIQKMLVTNYAAKNKTEYEMSDYAGKLVGSIMSSVSNHVDNYITDYNNNNSVLISVDNMLDEPHLSELKAIIEYHTMDEVQMLVDKVKAKALPGMIAGKDHDTKFSIQPGDKQVDILLRMLHGFEDVISRKRSLPEKIISYKKTNLKRQDLVSDFIDDNLAPVGIARFASKDDRKVNNIDYSKLDQDLFDKIISHATYLKELTENRGQTVHVPHEYDSPNFKNPYNVRYVPKARKEKTQAKHIATQLVSVDIGDNIKFDGEKVTGGSITMKFMTGYDDNGEPQYTTKYLLKSSDPSDANIVNFIKRFPFPFTTEEINEKLKAFKTKNVAFNELQYDVADAMGKKLGSGKKNMKTATKDDDGSDMIADLPATTPKNTSVDKDGPKATPPKDAPSVTGKTVTSDFDVNDPHYDEETSKNLFKTLLMQIELVFNMNNGAIKESQLPAIIKTLDALGIKHDSDLLSLHEHYKKKGYIDNYGNLAGKSMADIKIDKFAKSILETCS